MKNDGGPAFPLRLETIRCIADELRLTPASEFTKSRLVELGEMLERACKEMGNV